MLELVLLASLIAPAQAEFFGEMQPTGTAKFTLFTKVGETVDFANNQEADQVLLEPGVEVKLGRRFNARLNHNFQELDVAGGTLFTAHLSQLRLVYQFNVRMFVRTIMQYRDLERDLSLYTFPPDNAEEKDLFSELLFSYKVNPQTVVFVGYSDIEVGTDMISLTQAKQMFFVKLGYAWVR